MSEEIKLSTVSEDESIDYCNWETSSISSNNSKRLRKLSSSQDLSKEELIKKLKEYRKTNIELLEDKRHLLLRSQEAYKVKTELEQTKNEMSELKKRVNALEKNPPSSAEEIATNTIKELVRQLSNTSKKSEEQPLIDFNELQPKGLDEQDKSGDNRKRSEKGLHLPLESNMEKAYVCQCGATEKLSEVIKVNHYWQKDYTTLLEECNSLKARLWKTEDEMRVLKQANEVFHQNQIKTCKEDQMEVPNEELKASSKFTIDDIEALKQQLIIYKEDYVQEKEDIKKLTKDHNKLKLELQKAYGIIDNLSLKNNTIKENYRRISFEKEHIIKELRRLSTSTLPFSPVAIEDRLPSAESSETLQSQDIIPHSVPSIHIPGTFYGRGNVVRDGSPPLRTHVVRPGIPVNLQGELIENEVTKRKEESFSFL